MKCCKSVVAFLFVLMACFHTYSQTMCGGPCGGFNSTPTQVCLGASATLTTTYTSGVTWSVNSSFLQILTSTSGSVTVKGIAVGTGNLCMVYNANGAVCSVCKPVEVLALPVITTQPQPKSVCSGSPAQFSVVATGAVSYQWQENGINISNNSTYSGVNTATLTVNGSTSLNGKSYRVIVTNAQQCSVISNAAILTVNPYPGATVSGFAYDPYLNIVKCNALPASSQGYAYTWYIDNVLVSGPFNGFSQYAFTANCQQIYQVKVKVKDNATGCESVSSCKEFYLECGDNYLYDGVDDNTFNNSIVNRGACGSGGVLVESVGPRSGKDIVIYPNPSSSDKIQLEMNMEGTKKVAILNNFGEVISEKEVLENSLTLDVADLPKGQYFIRVITKEKNSLQRVMIE